jgi:protein SCO1/2
MLAIIAAMILPGSSNFRGTLYPDSPAAPEIALARDNGEQFLLSGLKGKIVLLFFGYTSCPDVCPTTLAELKQVLQQLGPESESVQVVFISVDPERDTPQRIQEYARRFNSSFIGLSGSAQQLEPIWDAYGIFREAVQGNSAAGYIVNHTARITLIDPNGNLRLSYGFDTPIEDIVHDIKLILK